MALSRITSWSTLKFSLTKLNLISENGQFVKRSPFKPLLCSSTNLPNLTCVSGKKTIAEELGLPEPPKRPSPSFLRFVLQEKYKYSSQCSISEALIKLGEEWSQLDESKKIKFNNEFTVEYEDFKKRLSAYNGSLTLEQLESMKSLKQKRKAEKQVRLERKIAQEELESLGKPKHPGYVFAIYIESLRNTYSGKEKFVKWAAEKWKTMTEKEKETFMGEAKNRLANYKANLIEWETKMTKIGRTDLLRSPAIRKQTKTD